MKWKPGRLLPARLVCRAGAQVPRAARQQVADREREAQPAVELASVYETRLEGDPLHGCDRLGDAVRGRREQELNLCDLEVVLKSGMRKAVRVEYHRGHWKNPMTDAEPLTIVPSSIIR